MTIRVDEAGNLLTRIGSGNHKIMLHAQGGTARRHRCGCALRYAGRLIHELGMYDDFTLWLTNSVRNEFQTFARFHVVEEGGVHPSDAVLLAQPTNLCIQMREGAVEGFLNESHPLVQAAIGAYETLFELPPIVSQSPSPAALVGIPAIAFGAGETEEPTHGGARVFTPFAEGGAILRCLSDHVRGRDEAAVMMVFAGW